MTSRFAAGAYVFPGGVVDEADGAEFWMDRVPDMPNLPGGGRAAVTAAIRELFEETGILLSDGDCRARDAASRERSRAISVARTALLAEDRSFADVTRELSATFTAAPMTYFARWVTPRRLSRRYDALFFLVTLPGRDQDVTITEEHDEASWVSAAEALEGFRSGEFPMLFPTWKTIEELASFADLEAAAAVLGSATVETIEPFLDVRGNTIQPRMPDGA
jgi:8-oxo-dGTP pyrophosphatase MutT (NUDIX family)